MAEGQVGLAIAFAAGVVSFASPCCLPLVPAYVANLAGVSMGTEVPPARLRLVTLLHALAFVAGFSIVFVAFWASLGLVGYLLPSYLPYIRVAGGGILVFLGFHVMGLWHIPFLEREFRPTFTPTGGTSYPRSFILGILFAGGWTPCIGPILAGIIGLASLRETAWQGTYLLMAYSIGLGVPFLATALAINSVTGFLKRLRPYQRAISLVSGLFIIAVGVLMITNLFARIPKFFYWGVL
jgi:cytochrome c-type biogenesis protein